MIESFAPHVGGEEPLSNLGMTEGRAALLPFALSLAGKADLEQPSRSAFLRTYDGVPLQNRGASVEHEDRFDAIE